MANTTNLNLVKPAGTDFALVSVINGNMDIIDSKVGAIPANESAQSQITALNNHVANLFSTKLKTASESRITDSKGNLRITSVGYAKYILSVMITSPSDTSYSLEVYKFNNNNYWGLQCRDSYGELLNNVEVAFSVLYYDT